MKKCCSVALLVFLVSGFQPLKDAADAATLKVDFSWLPKHRCSPRPPAFKISGIPKATKILTFKMTDLDVPAYNHGGGSVAYSGSGDIGAAAFSYRGPCPPNGRHRYQFEVKAINATGDVVLAKGKATRLFPSR